MANTYQDFSFCKFTVCEQRFQFKMIFQINIYIINNKKIFTWDWALSIFKLNGNAQFLSVFFTVRQLGFYALSKINSGE